MFRKSVQFFFFAFLTLSFITPSSHAATHKKKVKHYHGDFTKTHKYAALIVNAESGNVIYQKSANKLLHPASLTKLMTIYLAFKAIDEGDLKLIDQLPVSIRAASQQPTNMLLKANQTVSVKDALLGTIVHSANDATVVLAEAISGNETAFAVLMNETAKALGMKNTNFENSNGLPHKEQVTTAIDLAKLGMALKRDYSHYYSMFSVKSFSYRGRVINSHNRVLKSYPWADGLKTGFTNASGFNLITSTTKGNTKLIAVVMGGSSASARDAHMVKLLDFGHERVNSVAIASTSGSRINADTIPNIVELANSDSAFNVASKKVDKKIASNLSITAKNPLTVQKVNLNKKDVFVVASANIENKIAELQSSPIIKKQKIKSLNITAANKYKIAVKKHKSKKQIQVALLKRKIGARRA